MQQQATRENFHKNLFLPNKIRQDLSKSYGSRSYIRNIIQFKSLQEQ